MSDTFHEDGAYDDDHQSEHASSERKVVHLTIESAGMAEKKASALLSATSELSQTRIKQCMQAGSVWLTRDKHTARLRRASKPLKIGDELHLYFDERILAQPELAAQLLFDEGEYSLWFKPSGMLSQGSKWGDTNTVYRYSERHLQPQRPAFIVHRLDRAASGLMLIAHSKKMASTFSQMFEKRQITEKSYHARVKGDCMHWKKTHTLDDKVNGKPALSRVRCLSYDSEANQSLLEVQIETGRKHQIRKHLSGAWFAILGDRLYGHADEHSVDLQLRSTTLAFDCPISGEPKSFTLPDELTL